ncbi:MAG TPA: porin family protein [Chitinophagales bacterium]|nr:porin family protein [Chitinophagales bacterium]HMW13257.1 porin family protein [Chitinophagales bacterium]HMX61159.1 porin family protein [Chitinophagales bacterium]HMY23343.1 porin family protein [Chitinophagales bacterium]HMZ34673.1 porin family protein [Chitinophagales bacterium]
MHKIFLSVVLMLCASTFLIAQDSIPPSVKSTLAGPKGISEKVKKRITGANDRLVIELAMMNAIVKKDGGVTVPNDFKLGAFNRGINVYFMYDILLGKKTKPRHFSIAPGIGVGSENYYFKNYKLTWHYDTLTRFQAFGDSISSKKSKLNMTYIDVPIEFRYRSKPHAKTGMSWKIAVGFKLGFLVGSKWKYKGEDPNVPNNGETVTIKDMKVANMSKFRYGPTLRAGYGPLSLFAYYSIGSAFTTKGPKMNPIVFGISINGL